MNRKQAGFTLVEIAIVLVIIGLLLGGILKGQELINSARVRNLADTTSGVQAAYFGFIDRYRRVPGDWDNSNAGNAIGVAITGGGDNNGRIDHGAAAAAYDEPNAAWEQLAAAGFINGSFSGAANTIPTTSNGVAPLNAFNSPIIIGRTSDYQGTSPSVRLHLVIGRGIPVNIAQELDTKLDDGTPGSGVVRGVAAAGAGAQLGGAPAWGEMDATCVNGPPTALAWNVSGDSQDCNALFLF